MSRCFTLLSILFFTVIQAVVGQTAPVSTVSTVISQGSTASVPVTATGFTNITGFDLRLFYDPAIATATAVTSGEGLGGTMFTNLSVPGEITLSWFTISGVTLPGSSTIFTISFTRVAGVVGTTAIHWDTDYEMNVFYDGSYNPIPDLPFVDFYINGSLNFAGAPKIHADPPFNTCSANQVTVDVWVTDYYKIGSFSVLYHYNPATLQFVTATSAYSSLFDVFTIVGAVPGALTASANSNAFTGVTLPDNAVLLSVTFNILGGNTDLTWVNSGSDGQFHGPAPASDLLIDIPTASYYFNGSVTAPLASLSGSVSNQTNVSCYGLSTGSVTVSASGGTSPYTYQIGSEAFQSSATFTGLAAGNYTITIKDAGNCTFEVAVSITQASSALMLTASPTQILCFGGTGSIILTSSGGEAPYTYSISNPPISGLAAGTYTYVITDNLGCQASATAVIQAAPPQLILTATPTQPSCSVVTGSVALSISGGTLAYTYNPSNPPTAGLTAGTYTYLVSDNNGCQASATVVINATPLVYTLGGNVQYYSSLSPNLNGVTVKLQQGGMDITSTTTNASGNYLFSAVCPGTYTMVLSNTAEAGGVNATDAAQVSYFGVNPNWTPSLERVRVYAGDVITNQRLSAADAGRILQYYVTGGIPAWLVRAAWTFWPKNDLVSSNPPPGSSSVTQYNITISSSVTKNFWALCTGDFTKDFDPTGAKIENEKIKLNAAQTLKVKTGTDIDLPVYSTKAMNVGALSVSFNFHPELIEVKDVVMNHSVQNPLLYEVKGDELRMGWYSDSPLKVEAGEVLFTLKLRTSGVVSEDQMASFTLAEDPLNEIADDKYNIIQDVNLSMNRLVLTADEISPELAGRIKMNCLPNPFSDNLSLVYSIPEDGSVVIEVFTVLGEKVLSFVNEHQLAGDHTVRIDSRIIPPGFYTLNFQLKTSDQIQNKTIKILHN